MNKVTQLASGLIDGRDLLQVVLINHARPGRPPVTQIIWPTRPTTVDARPNPNTAATIMRLLAEASVTLAATKVYKR